VEQAVFLHRSSLFMVGKAQTSHGARSGLYGGWSNGIPPISVSASIVTSQSRNADAALMLLRHPKKCSVRTTVTPFSRSGWGVVRSVSLAQGGTSKNRPSPHLHEFPTRNNESTNFSNRSHRLNYNEPYYSELIKVINTHFHQKARFVV
jgi:hypothetical protein